MDYDDSAKLPLWVQSRDKVIANDEGVQWRDGERPDYSYTDQFLRVESEFNHPEGSLEAIVENLLGKNFRNGSLP
jgi:hypothetical protein